MCINDFLLNNQILININHKYNKYIYLIFFNNFLLNKSFIKQKMCVCVYIYD